MGRIQRPLNYKTPLERAVDWLADTLRKLRELGTVKQWAWEFLGCLLLFLALLAIYCLVP